MKPDRDQPESGEALNGVVRNLMATTPKAGDPAPGPDVQARRTAAMRGALISVGGSPEPIIHALRNNRVDYVLFIVSERSERQLTEQILPAIGYAPQWESLRLKDPDDLNSCYQQIRTALRDWINRRGLRNEELYFDLTGGTKPMAAALTLAGVERIPHYHYVSGERGKDGLGTVISGTERPVAGLNPWTQMAIRQRELATTLLAQGDVDAAGVLLEQAATSSPEQSETLKTYAALCRTLGKLDAFDFKGALNELYRCRPRIGILFEQHEDRRLTNWLTRFQIHLEDLDLERRRQTDFPYSFLELLANAARRGRQSRYDDGVARLYRAVELYGQNRLHRAFCALSGRIQLDALEPVLAEKLRTAFPECEFHDDNKDVLQLGLYKAFLALQFSPYPDDHRLVESYERLRNTLVKRNDSWLAHGTRPAGKADFDSMWDLVLKEFNILPETIPSWPEIRFTD